MLAQQRAVERDTCSSGQLPRLKRPLVSVATGSSAANQPQSSCFCHCHCKFISASLNWECLCASEPRASVQLHPLCTPFTTALFLHTVTITQ